MKYEVKDLESLLYLTRNEQEIIVAWCKILLLYLSEWLRGLAIVQLQFCNRSDTRLSVPDMWSLSSDFNGYGVLLCILSHWNQDIIDGAMTRLWSQGVMVQFPIGARDFSSHRCITVSGAHPVTSLVHARGSFSRSKAVVSTGGSFAGIRVFGSWSWPLTCI